jgi:hypothetical protein
MPEGDEGKYICRVVYNFPNGSGRMSTYMRLTEGDLHRLRKQLKNSVPSETPQNKPSFRAIVDNPGDGSANESSPVPSKSPAALAKPSDSPAAKTSATTDTDADEDARMRRERYEAMKKSEPVLQRAAGKNGDGPTDPFAAPAPKP